MNKLKIKKGDEVKILSGKDKGKTGKVLEVNPKAAKVVVEGINIRIRFSKAKKQGEKGQRLEIPSLLDVSKVMLICPSCGKPTKTGTEVNDNGNFRKCKLCAKVI